MHENLKQQVDALCKLIMSLKYTEALEIFYDPDIITYENENPSAIGIDAYKKAAKIFLASITNYKAELIHAIIMDDISACQWHYSFDHAQWGKWDKVQLSVQRWKNGKIILERHYYH